MISCVQMTELITDYLEQRLPLGDRLRFQFHLGFCRHCRAYLRQMRAVVRSLGMLPAGPPPPPEVEEELLRRFRDWKARPG